VARSCEYDRRRISYPADYQLFSKVSSAPGQPKINTSKIILVRHTIWNDNEVEAPSSVINHEFFIIIQFSSPLHVSASSGHPQERGKLLMYQDQPVITSPIPHALLLCMWELVTLIRHSTSCIRIICSSENPKDYL
jgi:hypothetical protein